MSHLGTLHSVMGCYILTMNNNEVFGERISVLEWKCIHKKKKKNDANTRTDEEIEKSDMLTGNQLVPRTMEGIEKLKQS